MHTLKTKILVAALAGSLALTTTGAALAQLVPQNTAANGLFAACNNTTINPATGQPYGCTQNGPSPGVVAEATGGGALAAGTGATSTGLGSVAIGQASASLADYSTAVGTSAFIAAGDTSGVALGNSAVVTATGGSSLGTNAWTNAANAVALGANSFADQANTVSVGSVGGGSLAPFTRRIVNLGAGTSNTDAVNVVQLSDAMIAFGGGASFIGGIYSAPTYILTSSGAAGTYNNVGSALTALDSGLAAVNTRIDNLPPPGTGPAGPQGPSGSNGAPGIAGPAGPAGSNGTSGTPGSTGPAGPQGPAGTAGTGTVTDALAVHYDNAQKNSVTLLSASGGSAMLHGVSTGVVASDGANVGQVNAQVQEAITTAKTYTDASSRQTLNWANSYTNVRFNQLEDRFSTTQAMATAQTQMVAAFAGADPTHHNRMAAGVGFAGGHNGVSAGYQHTSEDGTVAWNLGGAVAGNDRTIGAGVGYSW